MEHKEFIKFLKIYKPQEVLIQEGDNDKDFFCLLQGVVGIWKGTEDEENDKVKIGSINEKGTYFGEMGYLLQEQRTASIIAEQSVKVLKFPGEMLPQMLMKQPKLGLKISTALADRLKGTTMKQREASLKRDELRGDATNQLLSAKENYQKVFIMLTAIQKQFQNPFLKSVIEYMAPDKLLQGRKMRIDEHFMRDLPVRLIDLLKKAYPDEVQ